MVTDVVFDFDGTLVDSRSVARSKRLGVSPWRLPELVTQVLQDYRGALHEIGLHEGILELPRELRGRGLRLMSAA